MVECTPVRPGQEGLQLRLQVQILAGIQGLHCIESTSESAKRGKTIAKEPRNPSFLDPESLQLVVHTHFSASEKECELEPYLEVTQFSIVRLSNR